MFMAKNSIPAIREFFIIFGYKTSLLWQHFLTISMVSEMIAQATRKTANILRLKPAFLMKLASRVVNL
jgi:hypothetical protein